MYLINGSRAILEKNYLGNIELKGIYISQRWTANDWRAVDDENSKLSICEQLNRFKIKYIVEQVNNNF